MESSGIFTGEHALIAYVCMVASFALRTAPKPNSIWGLWLMSLLQFAFMNFTEGTSNMKTAQTGQEVKRSISTVTPATSDSPRKIETISANSVETPPPVPAAEPAPPILPKGDKQDG